MVHNQTTLGPDLDPDMGRRVRNPKSADIARRFSYFPDRRQKAVQAFVQARSDSWEEPGEAPIPV